MFKISQNLRLSIFILFCWVFVPPGDIQNVHFQKLLRDFQKLILKYFEKLTIKWYEKHLQCFPVLLQQNITKMLNCSKMEQQLGIAALYLPSHIPYDFKFCYASSSALDKATGVIPTRWQRIIVWSKWWQRIINTFPAPNADMDIQKVWPAPFLGLTCNSIP